MAEDKMKNLKRGHRETEALTVAEEPKRHFVPERDPLTILHKLPEEIQQRVNLLPVIQRSKATGLELEAMYNQLREDYEAEVCKKLTLHQRVDVMMLYLDMQDAESAGEIK